MSWFLSRLGFTSMRMGAVMERKRGLRGWVGAVGVAGSVAAALLGPATAANAGGAGEELSPGTGFGVSITSSVLDWGHVPAWADVNGDGRADYCRRVGDVNLQSSRVSCTLSTGTGFGATITSGVLDWGRFPAWADVNGDGKADYCRRVGDVNLQSSRVSCTLSTGTGFGATITSGVLDWG
jgi:hypothetical protein